MNLNCSRSLLNAVVWRPLGQNEDLYTNGANANMGIEERLKKNGP
jgi:hypothetical protein